MIAFSYTEWVLIYILILLVAILIVFMMERHHNMEIIRDLDEARDDSKKYINDLDNLLSMFTHFQEIGMTHPKTDDLQKLCDLIIEYATDLLDTKMGSLMLVNKSTNMLEIVASRGLSEDIIRSTKMYVGEGIAGRVTQDGKPIYCEDIDKDVRFMRHSNVQYTSKTFISVPLKIKNKVIGALNVNSDKKDRKFNQRDLRLINILADQAAIAIENIQLYNDMKEMYIGTIETLAKAIDAKDPTTRGHTDRVTKYAVEIAQEMNLPEKLIRNIKFASLIHDIGKIGVKDDVLLKPGKLTESEYEDIKKHPLIGEQILAPVEFLTNVAPLVLYHHERYDGNGYLEGLKGEEIPIGARIINVADSFEAMISDRPYSKEMSREAAVKELKDESGKQFDPKVVEAFLRILDKKARQKNKKLEDDYGKSEKKDKVS
ncbi:MAG: GAF domain-containing protein [Elusimicrobia bacterium]|nr:GAF domain-containing protein [Elusimicrobiota bacterium]